MIQRPSSYPTQTIQTTSSSTLLRIHISRILACRNETQNLSTGYMKNTVKNSKLYELHIHISRPPARRKETQGRSTEYMKNKNNNNDNNNNHFVHKLRILDRSIGHILIGILPPPSL